MRLNHITHWIFCICMLCSTVARGQSCPDQWTGFAGLPGVNDEIRGAAIASDGSLVAVGSFLVAGGVYPSRYVARFHPETGEWSSVGQLTDRTTTIHAVAVLANGDIVVGGTSIAVQGSGTSTLARFSVASGTWSALPSTAGNVYALAALPDGGVVVGGSFSTSASQPGLNISILNSDMTSWTALGTGCNSQVLGCIVHSTGDIVAVGNFSTAGGTVAPRVARYNRASNQWSAIGIWSPGSGTVKSVVELPGGDLVVGGAFAVPGDPNSYNIARFTAASDTWSGLGTGLHEDVQSIVYRPENDEIVAGTGFPTVFPGFVSGGLARFSLANQAWSSFGEPTSRVNTIALLSGGKLFVGGTFGQANLIPAGRCVIVEGDDTFRPATGSINSAVLCATPSVSGDLLVGGAFTHAGPTPVGRIARFNPVTGVFTSLAGGFLPTTIHGLATSTVTSVAELSNGDVIAAGDFVETAGGVTVNGLARFRPSVGQWEGIGTGATGVNSILREEAGSFLISGSFSSAGGVPSRAVARFNGSTQAWESVGVGLPSNAVIRDLIRMPNGDLYGVGSPSAMYYYNAASNQWTGFGTIPSPNFGNLMDTLLALPDGRIMVGGRFTSMDGIPMNNVAIFDPTTGTWSRASTGFSQIVRSLFLESETTVLIGGVQGSNPFATGFVLRYNLVADTMQVTNLPAGDTVHAFTRAANLPSVFVAGSFTTEVDERAASFLLSLLPPCPGDYDCSGGVDSNDVTAFFANWDTGDIRADFNRDGGVDSDDVIGFFGRWDAGC